MTSLKTIALSMSVLALGCGGGGGGGGAPANGGGGVPSQDAPSQDPNTPTPTTPSPDGSSQPNQPTTPTAAHTTHHHCGWIGADTAAAGTASFVANPDFFDAVHPKWYTLNPDGTPRAIAFTDDATVTQTARAHQVKLIPLIDYANASYIRGVIATPAGIAAHAQTLAAIARDHQYDGLELDYEHLWGASDRAGYVELIKQVAAALHAEGKVLTLALPAMDHDDGQSAYDYTALQASADVLHLMGYDFHYLGGDHLGPLAPKGWIESVAARVQSLGAPQKYVMGLANYGIGPGWYGAAADVLAKCQAGTYSAATDHMLTCPYGAREAGLAPHCSTPVGTVWFEDGSSIGEKSAIAHAHSFGGIAYWTLGGEPSGFFDAIRAQYP
jgi:spore germination protein YaaH